MNQCNFVGRLTRDPELKELTSSKVANFGLALDGFKKSGDNKEKETTFLDLEAWGKTAESISQYFSKGDVIAVNCGVRTETWDDKTTGQKRSKLRFRVNSFSFVPGTKRKAGDNGESETPTPTVDNTPVDADVPF